MTATNSLTQINSQLGARLATMAQILPPEIWMEICEWITHPHRSPFPVEPKSDIKNLRLTCRRIRDASTPFLIDRVSVCLTTESLTRLEAISKHPEFSTSVKRVRFQAAFYDGNMAENFNYFRRTRCEQIEWLAANLSYPVAGFYQAPIEKIRLSLEKISEEWERMPLGGDSLPESEFTSLLREGYEEYSRRLEDQETLRRNASSMDRISAAISRLPAVQQFLLNDHDGQLCFNQPRNVDKESVREKILMPSSWDGTELSRGTIKPPVKEFLIDLPQALAKSGVFPKEFAINVTSPVKFPLLTLSASEHRQISAAMQHMERLEVELDSSDSALLKVAALNELESVAQILAAWTDTRSIHEMSLTVGDWSMPQGFSPKFSLFTDISSKSWPRLRRMRLTCVGINLGELDQFVQIHRDSLADLSMEGIYLLTGTWAECLDLLRKLPNLEEFYLARPLLAEFGADMVTEPDFEEDLMWEDAIHYVLRLQDENPLRVDGGMDNPRYLVDPPDDSGPDSLSELDDLDPFFDADDSEEDDLAEEMLILRGFDELYR